MVIGEHPDQRKWFSVDYSRGRVGWTMKSVDGIDYTSAAAAAQRRAKEVRVACRYVVAREDFPGVPVRDASADLVYSEQGGLNGALIRAGIDAWARACGAPAAAGWPPLRVRNAHPAPTALRLLSHTTAPYRSGPGTRTTANRQPQVLQLMDSHWARA